MHNVTTTQVPEGELNDRELIVCIGSCQGFLMLPAGDVSDFYRGYKWAASFGLLLLIPVFLALLI